jgi:homocitrate synthase NifV
VIRVTDRTLSCLDEKVFDRADVLEFLKLLIRAEPDAIELSEYMYGLLSPLPDYPNYVLRVNRVADSHRYFGVPRFICRNESAENICAEVLLNDMREAYTIARYSGAARVRVRGLDDCFSGDYLQTFNYLKEAFRGRIEFCPGNRFGCASALAAEWVSNGVGDEVVSSFGGVGGFAPTEELFMIFRLARLRKVGKTYEFFPKMADLLRRITGESFDKPVIGERIFHVESGVHVDGILKLPKCYEPFPPEIVGRERKVVLGKHSGSASIRAKAKELGLDCAEERIPKLLRRVKEFGAKKRGALTDEEFLALARQ